MAIGIGRDFYRKDTYEKKGARPGRRGKNTTPTKKRGKGKQSKILDQKNITSGEMPGADDNQAVGRAGGRKTVQERKT